MPELSSKSHAALVIIGHGSTLNPDSSAPTFQHADEIRRRGIFAEVVCAFWKEEPSMREVYAMLDARDVYLVPNFISEGYFCQQVLPRELRVTGPITRHGEKTLFYCDPVGIHPNMTKLLLQRADEVALGVPRGETSLIIVGHGTSLNENSRKVIEQQCALIREGGHGFAEVVDAYMEEAPLVNEWSKLTTSPNVVVVPFFIADGLHSYQDIPVLLGMEEDVGAAASQREVFRHNPHALQGRKLYYSSAIGTEAMMADIVLDQIAEFDRQHQPEMQSGFESQIEPWLESKLEAGAVTIGEIRVARVDDGFELMHEADDGKESVKHYSHWAEARSIANLDEAGNFRPLKTAPTLVRGWLLRVGTIQDVRLALDAFYPAALGLARREECGALEVRALRENLSQQTGMYRFTNTIRDDQANDLVARCCDSTTKCQRRIAWDLAPGQALTGDAAAKTQRAADAQRVSLLCVDICPLLVGEARKVAQKNHQEKQASA